MSSYSPLRAVYANSATSLAGGASQVIESYVYPTTGFNASAGVVFCSPTTGFVPTSFEFDWQHDTQSAPWGLVQYSTDGANTWVPMQTLSLTDGNWHHMNVGISRELALALTGLPQLCFSVAYIFTPGTSIYTTTTSASSQYKDWRYDNVGLYGSPLPSATASVTAATTPRPTETSSASITSAVSISSSSSATASVSPTAAPTVTPAVAMASWSFDASSPVADGGVFAGVARAMVKYTYPDMTLHFGSEPGTSFASLYTFPTAGANASAGIMFCTPTTGFTPTMLQFQWRHDGRSPSTAVIQAEAGGSNYAWLDLQYAQLFNGSTTAWFPVTVSLNAAVAANAAFINNAAPSCFAISAAFVPGTSYYGRSDDTPSTYLDWYVTGAVVYGIAASATPSASATVSTGASASTTPIATLTASSTSTPAAPTQPVIAAWDFERTANLASSGAFAGSSATASVREGSISSMGLHLQPGGDSYTSTQYLSTYIYPADGFNATSGVQFCTPTSGYTLTTFEFWWYHEGRSPRWAVVSFQTPGGTWVDLQAISITDANWHFFSIDLSATAAAFPTTDAAARRCVSVTSMFTPGTTGYSLSTDDASAYGDW